MLIYFAAEMKGYDKLQKDIQILEFINKYCTDNEKLSSDIWRFKFADMNFVMENLVPIYEEFEKETFKLTMKIVPEKYKEKIPPEMLDRVK